MQNKKKRKGMLKRIVSILLACCMVLTGNVMTILAEGGVTGLDNVVSGENSKTASARSASRAATGEGTGNTTEFAGGEGTEEDPFLIKTADHLKNVGKYDSQNKRFKQITDIDLSGVSFTNCVINSFGINGGYDGGGYILYNFTLNQGSNSWPGFLGNGNGNISNLIFQSPVLTGTGYNRARKMGIVAGSLINGEIKNCAVINGKLIFSGGGSDSLNTTGGLIVGYPCENSKISNCFATGTIVHEDSTVPGWFGGIAGMARNRVDIRNCYFSGSITSANSESRISGGGIKYNPRYGVADAMSMENCYYNQDLLTNKTDYDYEYQTTLKTTAEMKSEAFASLMGSAYIYVAGEMATLAILARMYQGPHLSVDYAERMIKKEGENLKLSVEVVENNYNPTFQWYKDGTAIEGATKKTLEISSLKREDRGSYQCRVDNKMAFTQSMACWVQVWKGKGNALNPYQVEDQNDLEMITYDLAGHYLQVKDIALKTGWFLPIGEGRGQFTGLYDGAGYQISNLSIMGGGTMEYVLGSIQGDAGLFSTVGVGGTVRNLGVDGDLNSCRNYLGMVAGINYGTIEQCFSSGKVNSYRPQTVYVGGIVGANRNNGIIKNCYSTAAVSATVAASYVGGVCGVTIETGVISNSYFAGTLSSAGANYGGVSCVAAAANIDLISSFYKSDITTAAITAGTGTSVTAADLKTSTTILGNLGSAFYQVSSDYPKLWVQNREAPSVLIFDPVGGETAWTTAGKEVPLMADVINGKKGSTYTWYKDDVEVQKVTALTNYGEEGVYEDGITPEILKVVGSDDAIGNYHCVITKTVSGKTFTFTTDKMKVGVWEGGSGTNEDPYLVGGAKQFQQMKDNLTASYKQVRDIDMSAVTAYEPTGNSAAPFTGYYNGDGYMLENLTIQGNGDGLGVGVFGATESCSIQNLGCKNLTVSSGAQAVGGLIGIAKAGTTMSQCFIDSGSIANTSMSTANDAAASAGTAAVSAGGLVGSMETGAAMSYSYNRANVSNSFVGSAAEGKSGAAGGIAGYAPNNIIRYVYFAGQVTGGLNALRVSISNSASVTGGFYDSQKQAGAAVTNPSAITAKATAQMQTDPILTELGNLAGKKYWELIEANTYPSLIYTARPMTLQKTYPKDTVSVEEEGEVVEFETKIDARGFDGLYTYKWYMEGQVKPLRTVETRALSDKLSLPMGDETAIWAFDAGKYYCVVSNSAGEVTSRKAELTVASVEGAPVFTVTKEKGGTLENNGWINQKVSVSMEAEKGGVKPTAIYYRIGKTTQGFITYADPFELSAEGVYQIFAKADYGNGNVFNSSFQVNIDKTKPQKPAFTVEQQVKSNSRRVQVAGLSDTGGSGLNSMIATTSSTAPTGTEEGWKAIKDTDTKGEYEILENSPANGAHYLWIRDGAGNVSDAAGLGSIINVIPEIKEAELIYEDVEIGETASPSYVYNKDKTSTAEPKSVMYEQLDGAMIAAVNTSTGDAAAKVVGEARVKATLTNYNGNVVEVEGVVKVVNTPPVITQNPTDQGVKKTAASTAVLTYTVKASGTNNAYRWYYVDNGTEQPIQVQNNSGGHTITTSHSGNSGSSELKVTAPAGSYADRMYYAMVGNEGNTAVTSDKVYLFLYEEVHVTTNPSETTVTVAKEAQFKVVSDSTSPSAKYRWQVSKDNGGTWTDTPEIKKTIEVTGEDENGEPTKETKEVVDEEQSGTAPTFKIEKTTAEMNGWNYRCKVYNAGYPTGNFSSLAKLNVRTAPEKPIITLANDTENKKFESGKWNDEQFQFTIAPNGTVVGDARLQYQIVTLAEGDDAAKAAAKLSDTINETKNGIGAWTTAVSGAKQTVAQTTGTKAMVFARALNEWVYQNEKADGSTAAKPGGRVLMLTGDAAVKYDSFEAWYDSTPATGTIKFGTPEKVYNSLIQQTQFNLFYKDKLAVEITGEDKESGIAKIYYTWFTGKDQAAKTTDDLNKLTDGTGTGKWNDYSEGGFAVNAADEGARVIYAKIVNNAGTAAYISSEGFIMDSTVPVIANTVDADYKKADGTTAVAFVADNGGAKWTAEDSMKLQVNISDAKANVDESGVDKWRSAFSTTELNSGVLSEMKAKDGDWAVFAEGTDWKAYSSTAKDNQVSVTQNGFVYIQAIDKSGNITDIKKITINQFDRTAPTFTITASNVKNNAEEWINEDVILSVNDAADGGSGLAAAAYWFTGDTKNDYSAGSSRTYGQNGTYTVMVRDLVGNKATKTYSIGKIDKTIPEIAGKPALTNATYNDEWLSGTETDVTVNATGVSDKGDTIETVEQTAADIEGVYVQTTEAGTETTTAMTLTNDTYSADMKNPGETTKYWLRAKDKAGNWSAATAFTIKVDKTAPLIEDITESAEKTNNRYSISFTAGDYQDADKKTAGSGVAKVYYAKKSEVDESTLLTDAAKYTEIAEADGKYTFTAAENVDYVIRAVDNTGNMTSIIDAYARHGEIAASVPTQMMFAVIPNAAESFVTPEYTFTNLSTIDQVEVSVEKAVSKQGSVLVLGKNDASLSENTMKLYAEKTAQSEGFGSLKDAVIYETSGDAPGCKTAFGTLAASQSGTMKFKADAFGYSATEKALKKRGSWTLFLKLKAGKTI